MSSYFFRRTTLTRNGLHVSTVAATTAAAATAYAYLQLAPHQHQPFVDTTSQSGSTDTGTTGRTKTSLHRDNMYYPTRYVTYCDTAAQPHRIAPTSTKKDTTTDTDTSLVHADLVAKIRPGGQMIQSSTDNDTNRDDEKEVYYYGLFPLRQLFVPAMAYPLWDDNWDERKELQLSQQNEEVEAHRKQNHMRHLRKNGVTRHIILIRHGQYDETHKDDETRILTPLGRDQAHMTGKRIAEMIQGAEETFGSSCQVKALRVSNLTRAKETATIIASYLPSTVTIVEPDPMLNEGRPCHTIPGGQMSAKEIETTDVNHPRIEGAFRKYIYRAPPPPPTATTELLTTTKPEDADADADATRPESKHEFEIIVCHANVIRYIMCRALQLPPEAWLRFCPFNCSLTYLTIRPTGTVSCRMIGDIGHLPYSASTFSGHHGYNW